MTVPPRTDRLAILWVLAVLVAGATGHAGPVGALDQDPAATPPPAVRTVPPAPADGSGPATDLAVVTHRPAVADGPGRDGWRHASGVEVPAFSTIGVDLGPAGRDRTAEVRVHTHTGWGPWVAVQHHPEHGPDPGPEADGERPGAAVTDPVWVGLANAYEVRLPADLDPAAIGVLLVTDTGRPAPAVEAPPGPAARAPSAEQPDIRLRWQWGARPYRGIPEVASTFSGAIVHHSVSANAYTRAQVPGILRAIQAFHQDGNGWSDIAYNYAVDRFGTIWEARQASATDATIGGHTRGFNTATTGVVLLGDHTTVPPSTASLSAVGDVVGWTLHRHGVDPAASGPFRSYGSDQHPAGTILHLPRVSGHRDFSPTGCPGQRVYDRLGTVRARAAAVYRRAVAAETTLSFRPVVGDFDGDGADDVLLYRPGTAPDALLWGGPSPPRAVTWLTMNAGYQGIAVGDFDADGHDDLVLDAVPGGGKDFVWFGSGDGTFTAREVTIDGRPELHVGDFDGDGRDDVLLYGRGPGAPDAVWYGNPPPTLRAGMLPSLSVVPHAIRGYFEPLVADFDGDGRDDVLWYGAGSGSDALWWGGARRTFTAAPLRVNGLYRPVTGDLDGDGRADVFWYGPGPSPDAVWWGGPGRRFTSTTTVVNGRYHPVVAERSGDGVDDVLWYAPGAGADHLWWGRRDRRFATARTQLPGVHRPVVADLDGNGIEDVVWFAAGRTTAALWLGRPGGSHLPAELPLG